MASKEDRLKVQGDTSKTLATKYRPRTFNEIVGQAHASSILKKSLLERSVPQQILFSGGSGLGKTTLARVLGASLLCQTPQSKRNDMNPCLKCQSCSFIFSSDGSHPDLIEFDAASFGGKDEIKEIASRAQLAPMLGPVKVYIIDEAHGLSNAGGQAFLKLLEEPPGHVVFILCTTDPEKMLKTNRGRCVEFELLYPSKKQIKEHLTLICERENYIYSDTILDSIITKADPDLGVRGILMELSKVHTILKDYGDTKKAESIVTEMLGMASLAQLQKLAESLAKQNPLDSLDSLNEVLNVSGVKSTKKYLLDWLSSALSSKSTVPERLDWFINALDTILKAGDTKADLQLAVVKITTLDPGVTPVNVIVKESEDTLNKLVSAVEEARTIGARLYEVTSRAKKIGNNSGTSNVKASDRVTESTDSKLGTKTEGEGESKKVKNTPSRPSENSTSKSTDHGLKSESAEVSKPKINTIAAQLLVAAAPVPADLPAFLQQCSLTKTDREIIVGHKPAQRSVVKQYESVLRSAAGRLGMVLVISEK